MKLVINLFAYLIISNLLIAQNIEFETLGSWNENGYPDYLEDNSDEITEEFINRIYNSLPESKDVPEHHPEYISNSVQTNVLLNETADMYVTFVGEGAGFRNAFGFYTYEAGNPPDSLDEISSSMTIIFPNASKKYYGGELEPGDKVKIGTFSENTVIGWFIAANGFKNGEVTTGHNIYFSNSILNPEEEEEYKQHNVLLEDPQTDRVVLGLEDLQRPYGDNDFNDILFFITAEPGSAIDKDGIPGTDALDPSPVADLSITHEVDNSEPEDGEEISYTVNILNDGPDDAENVSVSSPLPHGVDFQNGSVSKGSYNEDTGIWNIGLLPNGDSETLQLTAKVDASEIAQSAFDLGDAEAYNVFVLNDIYQPTSDTEGKVAVGHEANFENYTIGYELPNSNGTEDVLIAENNLTYVKGNIFGGNVVYGKQTNLPDDFVNIPDGELRKEEGVIDFEAAEQHLLNLSNDLANYTTNGETTSEFSTIRLNGGNPFINVFEVEGDLLTASSEMNINVPNGAVVLVNISGNNIDWGGGLVVTGTELSNVLYNFHEAINLRIEGIDVTGSIIAPKADVNFVSGVQNGQMIAKNILGSAQFNNVPFVGNLPVDDYIESIAEIHTSEADDPDSNPGNGKKNEDDYASSEVYINTTGDNSGGGGNTNVTWSEVGFSGNNQLIWTMELDKNFNLVTGNWGGKIYRSNFLGTDWEELNPDMNVSYIWALGIDDDYLFAGTDKGLYRSTDNGSTWELNLNENSEFRAVVIEEGIIYTGTWGNGLYKSTDMGENWDSVSDDLNGESITSIELNSQGDIFVGTFNNSVFRSTDGGSSFEHLDLEYKYVWTLNVDKNDNIFAGTYGNGMFSSTDNGETWAKDFGVTANYIYSILLTNYDILYASSWNGGIFYGSNPGFNKSSASELHNSKNSYEWESIGLTGFGVSSLQVGDSTGVLLAATDNGKLYRTDNAITSVESGKNKLPSKYELKQNYPNPFNPATTIKFNLKQSKPVTLKVFNILGEEVKTLINKQLNKGLHSVKWNGTDNSGSTVAAGPYIYELRAGEKTFTKKMMLIK